MTEEIITLTSLTYMRAQLLMAMLERNGISCFMTNINRIKEGPGGVNVKINKTDYAEAVKIFDDFRGSYGFQKQKAVEYMKRIRKILVPVDFTHHSENAAFYALQLAAEFKSDIKLMNAYLNPLATPQSYLESYAYQLNLDQVISEIEQETNNSLSSMAQRLKAKIKKEKIKGVNISYDLVKGNVIDAILNYTEGFKPGMIVMGTRGWELEGFRSFGSIASAIIKKANIPVVAVPKDYDSLSPKPPKRVLYATDFDDTDFAALRRLVSFVKPFNSKIYCIHASLENLGSFDENRMRKIKNYLFETIDTYKIECGILNTYDMQQGIEDFIQENEIDVLALNTHQKPFIERLFSPSITRQFLFQTHIPLLVFHARP
jgi:nucleotide-binding universal stress UspA family protein